YSKALSLDPYEMNVLANQAALFVTAGEFARARNNLAGVFVRAGRSPSREVAKCLFLRAAMEMLEGKDVRETLQFLRAVLNSKTFVSGPWAMDALRNLLEERLSSGDFSLLRAVWEAISEGVKGSALVHLDGWKALPIPELSGSWAQLLGLDQRPSAS
ncbi:MAG: hypothetical protein ABIH26_13805, partial [Candidatus Eisenbacteria bacterium]